MLSADWWLSLFLAFCSRLLLSLGPSHVALNVIPRNVPSLLILNIRLHSVGLMLLNCICWLLVKTMHCVLTGLSVILQRFDQSSMSVMHCLIFDVVSCGECD